MLKENNPNRSIHCTVDECKYHYGEDNYCSLDSIMVGSHEKNPTDESCVDCRSFDCDKSCMC